MKSLLEKHGGLKTWKQKHVSYSLMPMTQAYFMSKCSMINFLAMEITEQLIMGH